MNYDKIKQNILGIIDADIKAFIIIEHEKYEIESFHTNISQSVNHNGQPINEVKGGQLSVSVKQTVSPFVYEWSKKSMVLKSGYINFETEMSGSIFKVNFENASCISLICNVNSHTGATTTLTISSERISFFDDLNIDNRWNL